MSWDDVSFSTLTMPTPLSCRGIMDKCAPVTQLCAPPLPPCRRITIRRRRRTSLRRLLQHTDGNVQHQERVALGLVIACPQTSVDAGHYQICSPGGGRVLQEQWSIVVDIFRVWLSLCDSVQEVAPPPNPPNPPNLSPPIPPPPNPPYYRNRKRKPPHPHVHTTFFGGGYFYYFRPFWPFAEGSNFIFFGRCWLFLECGIFIIIGQFSPPPHPWGMGKSPLILTPPSCVE